MAKLILGKGAIAMARTRDSNDEPTIVIQSQVSPKLELVKGTVLGIPMEERDMKFELSELSPEGQKAAMTLLAEVEGKIKAAALPRAQKLAKDAGIDLES